MTEIRNGISKLIDVICERPVRGFTEDAKNEFIHTIKKYFSAAFWHVNRHLNAHFS